MRANGIEVDAALVVVAGDHRGTDLDASGGRTTPARQEVEERRLARSVGTDEAQPLPRAEEEINLRHDRYGVSFVAKPDSYALDHLVAEARHPEGHLDLRGARLCLCATRHDAHRRVDPRLWLAGASRGASSQPGKLSPGEVAPGGFGGGRLLLTLGAPGEICGVSTFVLVPATSIELDHPGGDAVEEMAVVCHQDETATEVEKPLLQPRHCSEIQMVRGLVKDEQLRRSGQHGRQRHALCLPTGQLGEVGVGFEPHPEPVQRSLGLPARASRRTHRARRQRRLLLEVADADAPPATDVAGTCLLEAGEDP